MTPTLAQLQTELIADAAWAVKNEPSIHYTGPTDPKVRPMPLTRWKAHMLPIYTDCSGFVTCLYYRAGAPDPNGRNYDGQGYTGTLLDNGQKITKAELHAGDLVIYVKADGSSVHVVMIVKTGTDPTVVSHGTESGPNYNSLSGENAWFAANEAAHPVYIRALPDTPNREWRITAGDGTRLAKTQHPVRWAIRHPRAFRKRQRIRFTQT